ncbi:DUF2300 domain-containing protein [Cronobacter sakazakii]|uniref:DUF2300 domain-containing protein n=1 Tax=Cronobacter sakazakii TaxID=28141 RepID=UPI00294B29C0|nr:DUF2300 domain-containing protein [Cronobacter sakazakii]
MRKLFFIVLILASAAADARGLMLAWRRDNQDILLHLKAGQGEVDRQSLPTGLTTPLGSVWKLFVYAWLTDNRIADNPYHCTGQSSQEVYCCAVGESIAREKALVQSCGLYFTPERWHIDSNECRRYWQKRGGPAWLNELRLLQPGTEVTVS